MMMIQLEVCLAEADGLVEDLLETVYQCFLKVSPGAN
jgi:hypothetical protein